MGNSVYGRWLCSKRVTNTIFRRGRYAIDLWSGYAMKRSQSVAKGLSFRACAIATIGLSGNR
ncbi:MAG: hypothetical protein F6J90_37145 [Moorea sp. SIOASIH]|uniref:hypothetical protein n=1 Tax=Moorena sp. SIOASIH TaxID=2607817 RepID=UPI0013B9C623|nr:hypothetical protein [Moorena sp. SIOASIH]NEO41656.1 hypothetical protein [Moorena sp. SIOASIH]